VFLPVDPKLPLAAMEGIEYPTRQMHLEIGECIILYTDGVTEASNAENKLYGDDRLISICAKAKGLDENEIITLILDDVNAFVAGAPQADDLTIAVLKRYGHGRYINE
jgi:serine phosphatase RsbU (regulator of sigma subunit)